MALIVWQDGCVVRQVRFCGGVRDGEYIPWDNNRPWPPEIPTCAMVPNLVYARYHRLGGQDATGAEIYVSAEVRDACCRGIPLDAQDIAPVHFPSVIRTLDLNDVVELLGVPQEVIHGSMTDLLRWCYEGITPDHEDATPAEVSHNYDRADMSGKKEYPLDAVAAENARREAALRQAQDCIDSIDEVIE